MSGTSVCLQDTHRISTMGAVGLGFDKTFLRFGSGWLVVEGRGAGAGVAVGARDEELGEAAAAAVVDPEA
jgi:hypothetical protein